MKTALAIPSLCFWPPLSLFPDSPTLVCIPSGKLLTYSAKSAISKAAAINRSSQQVVRPAVQPTIERPAYTPSVSRGIPQQTTSGGASPVRNSGGIIPSTQGSGQPVNNQRVIPQQNQPQQQQIQRGGGGGGTTPAPSRGTGGGGTGVRRN